MDHDSSYIPIKKIASGGFADIYLAHLQNNSDDEYILKKLRKEFFYDTHCIELLKSEYEILTSLRHPFIVKSYGLISHPLDHYIILEYVDGKTLAETSEAYKANKEKIPISYTMQVARQLAETLDYLYQASGIVYLDLNSQNIILQKSGNIKLIDFSSVQTPQRKLGESEGVGAGILMYMSPEQISRQAVDIRSSIFSIGTLLYEMIEGKKIFDGKNPFDVYCNVKTKKISGKDFSNSVDEKLVQIITKCLENNPDDRFQSFIELSQELHKIPIFSGGKDC